MRPLAATGDAAGHSCCTWHDGGIDGKHRRRIRCVGRRIVHGNGEGDGHSAVRNGVVWFEDTKGTCSNSAVDELGGDGEGRVQRDGWLDG